MITFLLAAVLPSVPIRLHNLHCPLTNSLSRAILFLSRRPKDGSQTSHASNKQIFALDSESLSISNCVAEVQGDKLDKVPCFHPIGLLVQDHALQTTKNS